MHETDNEQTLSFASFICTITSTDFLSTLKADTTGPTAHYTKLAHLLASLIGVSLQTVSLLIECAFSCHSKWCAVSGCLSKFFIRFTCTELS